MKEAEFYEWQQYSKKYGFPIDRIVHAIAIGSAAVARTMGGKINADELVPRYEPVKQVKGKIAAELFEGWLMGANGK